MTNKPRTETGDTGAATPTCFVAMPFSERWSDGVYRAIESVMRSVKVDIFRLGMRERLSHGLVEDIETQIKAADIVLADTTGGNPNVHLELGMAMASGKELVLCTQSGQVCSDLSGIYYTKYSTTPNGLEELTRQLRLLMQECLKSMRLRAEKDALARQLEYEYSVVCFSERTHAQLHNAFARARRRIDILTTNLSWLFEPLRTTRRSTWSFIQRAVCARPNLKLRVLTLDPESKIAAARGRQLGFSADNFRAQLRAALAKARKFEARMANARVEIRLYDQLPTQITFRVDDDVYTGIVGQPMQCRHYPVLRFSVANLGVNEAFLSHFLSVWRDSLPCLDSVARPAPRTAHAVRLRSGL